MQEKKNIRVHVIPMSVAQNWVESPRLGQEKHTAHSRSGSNFKICFSKFAFNWVAHRFLGKGAKILSFQLLITIMHKCSYMFLTFCCLNANKE